MSRTAEPPRSRPHRVPWLVERGDPRHPLVVNGSREPADFVRIFRSDGVSEHWGQVLPGEEVAVCRCAVDVDPVTMTLAWYRWRTDEEYCWTFVA